MYIKYIAPVYDDAKGGKSILKSWTDTVKQ